VTHQHPPEGWIALCRSEDIANNSSKGFELAQFALNLFVVKKRERIFVYRNRCPHLGLPLNWMPDKFLDLDAELIQCSAHGARFRIDTGQCVAGPCVGQQLESLPFMEVEGQIWLAAPDQ